MNMFFVTNAHIAALKTAVAALQADRGLFVATNGKYLERQAAIPKLWKVWRRR